MQKSFEFHRLHLESGALSIGVYQSSPLGNDLAAHVEFLVQLNRWNALGRGLWQYWS